MKIINARSKQKPALRFVDCSFNGDQNLLVQDIAAYGDTIYASPVEFENCVTDIEVNDLIQGEWASKNDALKGVSRKNLQPMSDAEACMRRALRAFFPSHIGNGSSVQARRYIRLSALGRGSMPAGAPGQEVLKQVFESVGFTTGGRSDHLYAPWSSVVGATQAGLELRAELLDFLRDGTKRSTRVKQMITRIESQFR